MAPTFAPTVGFYRILLIDEKTRNKAFQYFYYSVFTKVYLRQQNIENLLHCQWFNILFGSNSQDQDSDYHKNTKNTKYNILKCASLHPTPSDLSD